MTILEIAQRAALITLGLTVVTGAVSAQGKGKGNGGGGGGGSPPPQILRPAILGYSNQHGVVPPSDMTVYLDGSSALNVHPEQFSPNGKNRTVISAVSPAGDLTHGGGDRWIFDVRLTGTASTIAFHALIVTPESVGSVSNPTWYYVPAEDDSVDRVLLDSTSPYLPRSCACATAVTGGKLRVAFAGSGPVGGVTKSGLFVGQVDWDSSDPSGLLQDISLIVEGSHFTSGPFRDSIWKWGTRNQLVYTMPDAGSGRQIWFADVSGIPGLAPTLIFSGVQGDVHSPALSRDGLKLAYVGPTANGYGVFVRDLAGGTTITLPTGKSIRSQTIDATEWSPDGSEIIYNARPRAKLGDSTYRVPSSGSGTPKQLTTADPQTLVGRMEGKLAWRQ